MCIYIYIYVYMYICIYTYIYIYIFVYLGLSLEQLGRGLRGPSQVRIILLRELARNRFVIRPAFANNQSCFESSSKSTLLRMTACFRRRVAPFCTTVAEHHASSEQRPPTQLHKCHVAFQPQTYAADPRPTNTSSSGAARVQTGRALSARRQGRAAPYIVTYI